MKYSRNYNKSFLFYITNLKTLKFCPFTLPQIEYKKDGPDAKEAFFIYESQGKIVPTKHPRTLFKLLKFKAALNWQVKDWAEGIEDTYVSVEEFLSTFKNPPNWLKKHIVRSIRKNLSYPYKQPFWDKDLCGQ